MKNESVKQTIRYYERITAGRFYDKAQKERLFELSAKVNFINEKQTNELRQAVFSSDVEDCATVYDCENGLLFVMLNGDELTKEILDNKKRVLVDLLGKNGKPVWEDRFAWISDLHNPKMEYKRLFERAHFEFANGNLEKAVQTIQHFAKMCDLDSVKFLIATYSILGNSEKELEYLLIYSRLIKELYSSTLSPEARARIKQLTTAQTESLREKVNQITLKYFDEHDDCCTRVGF